MPDGAGGERHLRRELRRSRGRTPPPIVWKCTGSPLAATASHIGFHHGSHNGVMSCSARDLEAAHAAAPGDPLDLADRGVDVVVRDAGEPGKAVGMGIAEAGEPFVVDAQHLAGRFVVIDPAGGAEDAVQYLGLDPVAVLVLDPQFGIGHAADALLAVLVDPFRRHPVRAVDLARLVEAAGRAHAVHQPERGAFLGHPLLAPRPVGHVGHAVLHCGRGIGGEQIGRQPDQIDMAVGRDHIVFHWHILRASLTLA